MFAFIYGPAVAPRAEPICASAPADPLGSIGTPACGKRRFPTETINRNELFRPLIQLKRFKMNRIGVSKIVFDSLAVNLLQSASRLISSDAANTCLKLSG